jgi:RNA polymerase sigma-70 factor (ECF subfamily)
MQRSVLLSQLDSRLRSVQGATGRRDRDLFWLYYLQGLTAEEIAALPSLGLTPKGVESALRRVTIWLRGEIERTRPEDQPDPG